MTKFIASIKSYLLWNISGLGIGASVAFVCFKIFG